VHRGAMHLGGGGGGERLRLERGVQLFRRRPQFLGDDEAHLIARERWNGVLQLRELGGHFDREHRGLTRDYLADLDVGGPELLEHEPDLDGWAGLLPTSGQTPGPGLQGVTEAASIRCPLEDGVVAVAEEGVVHLLQAQILAKPVK